MEENNANQQQEIINNENEKNICFRNHCWKKCLAMVTAAFLGGFLAVYFVTDQTMHKYHRPPQYRHPEFRNNLFDEIDRMQKQDMAAFEDAFNSERIMKNFKMYSLDMPEFAMASVKVKTEYDDDKYNIIVDLKHFNNDDSKVKYNVKGRKLTVYGSSEVKDKDFTQDISFSQDFILPKNADTKGITKTKENKQLIISIPLKDM